ncbi:MAG: hypothetical protein U0842_05205 [Candidatus Binatia bacterium]
MICSFASPSNIARRSSIVIGDAGPLSKMRGISSVQNWLPLATSTVQPPMCAMRPMSRSSASWKRSCSSAALRREMSRTITCATRCPSIVRTRPVASTGMVVPSSAAIRSSQRGKEPLFASGSAARASIRRR